MATQVCGTNGEFLLAQVPSINQSKNCTPRKPMRQLFFFFISSLSRAIKRWSTARKQIRSPIGNKTLRDNNKWTKLNERKMRRKAHQLTRFLNRKLSQGGRKIIFIIMVESRTVWAVWVTFGSIFFFAYFAGVVVSWRFPLRLLLGFFVVVVVYCSSIRWCTSWCNCFSWFFFFIMLVHDCNASFEHEIK